MKIINEAVKNYTVIMENLLKNKDTQLVESAMNIILNEHIKLVHTINYEEVAALIPMITNAKHIFIMGAGRTGLMMKVMVRTLQE